MLVEAENVRKMYVEPNGSGPCTFSIPRTTMTAKIVDDALDAGRHRFEESVLVFEARLGEVVEPPAILSTRLRSGYVVTGLLSSNGLRVTVLPAPSRRIFDVVGDVAARLNLLDADYAAVTVERYGALMATASPWSILTGEVVGESVYPRYAVSDICEAVASVPAIYALENLCSREPSHGLCRYAEYSGINETGLRVARAMLDFGVYRYANAVNIVVDRDGVIRSVAVTRCRVPIAEYLMSGLRELDEDVVDEYA